MYFSGDQAEIHCSAFTSAHALAVAVRLAERMASSYHITRTRIGFGLKILKLH